MFSPRQTYWQYFFSVILLCVGLCWICSPALASGSTQAGVELHLLRPGIAAVADLDGDHIPDVASGTSLGRTPQGYAYRVDLDLSENRHGKPLSVFSSEPNGLDIKAIDVDGDHDLDLVITSRLLKQPIGIWLNDGLGNFTPGDTARYALAFWRTSSSLASSTAASAFFVCREPRAPEMALDRQTIAVKPVELSAGRSDSVLAYDCCLGTESARLRAPPAVSSL